MFSLSRQFVGHEQDVRDLTSTSKTIFSCSRDSTVREWQIDSSSPTEAHQYRTHTGFVNSLTYHDGYIVSGGKDATINLVKVGASEPTFSLLGHTSNVCALHACPDGSIISGSWDGTARLWKDGKCVETMEGHEGAVWAVLWSDHGILTGGADRTIRLWKAGRQIKNFPAGKDCVRALALHPVGFVSSGNDSIIRLHTFAGEVVQQLEGHESFVYSLATTLAGDIYSVGEDRTMRVWQNGSLKQTVLHPAISVWCVTVMDNGDVVTGASDSIVRVFSSSPDRIASTEDLKAYEESVAASAIPAQKSDIPNNLPGLEALAGPGSKEGEVKMIRTSPDLVEAHQWSGGVWTKIGEVMGASSKRVEYEGKEWDFVFDVDIAEGQPPLKLPYNTEENPYEAADRFIARYELDVGFQAQIVKFIETNTGGIPLGVKKEAPPEPQSKGPAAATPQSSYLSMLAGNSKPILAKLVSLADGEALKASITILDDLDTNKITPVQIDSLLHIVQKSPREKRFPALDLLRLSIPTMPSSVSVQQILETILEAAEFKADMFEDKCRETNIMLALRCLANLYCHSSRMKIVQSESLIDSVSGLSYPSNRNLSLAQVTFLLNSAVLAFQSSSSVLALNLLDPVLALLKQVSDSEVQYRALVALGTLLRISDDVVEGANDVFDAKKVLGAIDGSKEERTQGVLKECTSLLDAEAGKR